MCVKLYNYCKITVVWSSYRCTLPCTAVFVRQQDGQYSLRAGFIVFRFTSFSKKSNTMKNYYSMSLKCSGIFCVDGNIVMTETCNPHLQFNKSLLPMLMT